MCLTKNIFKGTANVLLKIFRKEGTLGEVLNIFSIKLRLNDCSFPRIAHQDQYESSNDLGPHPVVNQCYL